MEKWETYQPQQAEEEKTEAVEVSEEAPNALEGREASLNQRIQALKAARDEAERKLQEAILDLEMREHSPAFQKAKELFEGGDRLFHGQEDGYATFWRVPSSLVTEFDQSSRSSQEEYAYPVLSEQEGYATFSPRRDLIADLHLQGSDQSGEVLNHLVNLTQEAANTR